MVQLINSYDFISADLYKLGNTWISVPIFRKLGHSIWDENWARQKMYSRNKRRYIPHVLDFRVLLHVFRVIKSTKNMFNFSHVITQRYIYFNNNSFGKCKLCNMSPYKSYLLVSVLSLLFNSGKQTKIEKS